MVRPLSYLRNPGIIPAGRHKLHQQWSRSDIRFNAGQGESWSSSLQQCVFSTYYQSSEVRTSILYVPVLLPAYQVLVYQVYSNSHHFIGTENPELKLLDPAQPRRRIAELRRHDAPLPPPAPAPAPFRDPLPRLLLLPACLPG